MTIFEARKFGSGQISEFLKSSQTPQLDCDVILQHIFDCTRTFLLMNRDMELSEKQQELFFEAIEKRKTGLPVAYITGHKEFYGYDFFVTPDVLIPKPDTEILVETGTAWIISHNPNLVVDMCTGSGCVGISVALEIEKYFTRNNISLENFPYFILVDISLEALKIAKKNAGKLLSEVILNKFIFVESNLFESVRGVTGEPRREGSGQFKERTSGQTCLDICERRRIGSEGETSPTKIPEGNFNSKVILTNPPYVPKKETDELLKDGRNEPRIALNGDVFFDGRDSDSDDGLELIRRLILQAKDFFSEGDFQGESEKKYLGALFMETGEYNAESASELFKVAGFSNVNIKKDLNGMLRVVCGEI